MGRPSNREERRREILGAFARVLADHGYAGATIAAVANEAGIAPGLVHHHFESKDDLLRSLLALLIERFRDRVRSWEGEGDPLDAYADAALGLGPRADQLAARCWVGLFAEAIRNRSLYDQMRRLLDTEILAIQRRSGGEFSSSEGGRSSRSSWGRSWSVPLRRGERRDSRRRGCVA